MTLRPDDDLYELRAEIETRVEETHRLELDARGEQWRALRNMRRELRDLDRDLFLAPFIANDSRIRELTNALQQDTENARRVLEKLEAVREALAGAREKVAQVQELADRAEPLFAEVESLVDQVRGVEP